MKITKKQLKKMIYEAFEDKEPMDAPATSWELAMEKVYDLAEMAQKLKTMSEDAISTIQKEYDQLDSKAFKLKQTQGQVPQSLMNKLEIMDHVIDRVRKSRRTSEQLISDLKRFI